MRYWLGVICLIGFVASPPQAAANRNGAKGGWNGSIASGGLQNNCMSCHGSQAGTGGVALIGAPVEYRLGELYSLTVRVSDPDQVGAGFQLSVEDAGGEHVGTLIISDAVNTQEAPVDPNWVTHTADGVDQSVANWSAMGNAAEYDLQWRAPDADAGDITFFLAGNAINDDFQAFNGSDRIYLNQLTAFLADTCADGVQNGDETGIDCGGSCAACECFVDEDCSDGVFCNGLEACIANMCQAGVSPCPDQDCDESADRCVDCLANGDCDDGSACTVDACSSGACANTVIAGCCNTQADCDDGVFCNGRETCIGNNCLVGSDACPNHVCDESGERCVECLVDADCEDNDACTGDACVDDACVNEPVADCPPAGAPLPDDGAPPPDDADGDGVADDDDLCDNTPEDATADADGCSCDQLDDDLDSVSNCDDLCPGTPENDVAGADGCAPSQSDSDHDGVDDATDLCPDTMSGETVGEDGCPIPPPADDGSLGDDAPDDDDTGGTADPGETPSTPPTRLCGALGIIGWLLPLAGLITLRPRESRSRGLSRHTSKSTAETSVRPQ